MGTAMQQPHLERTKPCRDCCQPRPLARFLPSRHTADGRVDCCLDCIRLAAQRQRDESDRRRALAEQSEHPARAESLDRTDEGQGPAAQSALTTEVRQMYARAREAPIAFLAALENIIPA
jgi:hypothetical protein